MLFVFDIIFVFTEIRVWGQVDDKNPVWQTIKPLHGFGIFCFVVINCLKALLGVLACRALSEVNKAVRLQ